MFSSDNESTTITISSTTPVQSTNELEKIAKSSFTVVETSDNSTFELDRVHNIARVRWVGNVNLNTADKLLSLGGDSVEFDGYKRLLIDRFELKEFDTDARIWIKEFFKTRARKLSKNVERMAIINPETSMAGVFSNMLTSAISLIMPGLTVKKFDSREEGINWLLE